MGAVVAIVIVLSGAALISLVYLQNKKRREAIARWASARGWTYVARDDSWTRRWSGTPFGKGHSRRAQNVLTGSLGDRRVVVFDYEYRETQSTGDNNSTERTYRYSIYAVALPCALPRVSVDPEGFFSKVARAVGVRDIELESEEFNRAFRLAAADRKLAYDLIPARNMELLLTQPDIHFRTEGDTLLCFDDKRLDLARVDARLDLLSTFLDNVPSFVWSERGVSEEGN